MNPRPLATFPRECRPFGPACPLSVIEARPEDNCRRSMDPASLEELARSLKRGQLEPCLGVPGKNGKIRLVCGFRRHAASRIAGMSTLWVEPLDLTGLPGAAHMHEWRLKPEDAAKIELEIKLANGAENVARQQLTAPEKARLIADLTERYNPSGKTPMTYDAMISDRLGCSREIVTQYRLFHQKLAPDVLEAWLLAPGALTNRLLQSWTQLAHAEQRMALAKLLSGYDQEDDLDLDERPRPTGDKGRWTDGKRASRAKIRAAMSALRAGDFHLRPDAWVQGAADALAWVLGDADLTNEGDEQISFPLGSAHPRTPARFKPAPETHELEAVPEYPETSVRTTKRSLGSPKGRARSARR